MLRQDLRRIERVVFRCCRCPALRDDIVQLASLRVLRAAQRQGRALASFSDAYLARVARSAMIDEVRRALARPADPLGTQARPDASTPGPEARTAAAEIGVRITTALHELSAHRRRAVTLYLHGHNVPEIAGVMGDETKRAENLVYRGLADLRRLLAARGVSPSPAS